MNITTNYQIKPNSFYQRRSKQKMQSNPSFGNTQQLGKTVVAAGAAALAGIAASTLRKPLYGCHETKYGKVEYFDPKAIHLAVDDPNYKSLLECYPADKSALLVTRNNGTCLNLFNDIPKEVLQSPMADYVHQVNCSTINPNVGIILTQNQSDKTNTARVVSLDGTVQECAYNNNKYGVPIKVERNGVPYIDTPWNPGRQNVTQRSLQVTYGNVKADYGARPEYIAEYADPVTGEAPDVSILAAQKGTDDRSFVPADIAYAQYDILKESGERIPCDYDKMVSGVEYNIAKKGGVELKMAVPPTEVISSEGEVLPAGYLYMVDSMAHFYNGNPIKRIKSGEVTWNADVNDAVQAQIRNDIDESLKLEKEAKAVKNEAGNFDKQSSELREIANKKGNIHTLKDKYKHNANVAKLNKKADELAAKAGELKAKANELNAQAKQLTSKAEREMTEWVKTTQNPGGAEFLAE